tara:strand:- start:16 stop:309 length:294 start_codon:yes stop_codon:yes gene_type:complete
MARHHATPEGNIPFTDAEETARDAEEKAELEARPAKMFKIVRRDRDIKLQKTDWMILADSPDISDEWKTYRQALRDFPSTLNDTTVLETITWPDEPE